MAWRATVHQGGENGKVEKEIILAVLILGVTSTVTQIILLREFLSVFSGNELVIGIILATWMMLTGLGSYLGRFSGKVVRQVQAIIAALSVMAILPGLTVFLLRSLRNVIFTAGGMIEIGGMVLSSAALLAPYCIIAGWMFAFFTYACSERSGANLITNVYSWEAIGAVAGGLVFNVVLIFFLTTFQSLFLLMLLSLAAALALAFVYRTSGAGYVIAALTGVCMVLYFTVKLDDLTRRYLFPEQEILAYTDTPYGNITVTRQADQVNFFENNILLFSTNDVAANEEAVHYAMIQHPKPNNVLLISGGISGTTAEILKYDVERIDYVEMNRGLVDIGRRYTTALADSRITVIHEDPRSFIRETALRYDVVLINLPEPVTAQINRLYSLEWFRDLKLRLNPAAVVSLSLLPGTDYVGGEAREINSIIRATLGACFNTIRIVPGMRNYFLASDADLHLDISRRIAERGIRTEYVNAYYIDDAALSRRSAVIEETIIPAVALNEDFSPVAYHRQLDYWLSFFGVNLWIVITGMVIVITVVLLRVNTVTLGIFTGGCSASSLEVLLLIAFQIIYGYVYQIAGIIITVFMAGLAVGVRVGPGLFRGPDFRRYAWVQFSIGVYAAILPVILLALKGALMPYGVILAVFMILTGCISLLIGAEFAMASTLSAGRVVSVASALYSIDLVGSALGALITATYLVPVFGIVNTCIIIALINVASGMVAVARQGRLVPSRL